MQIMTWSYFLIFFFFNTWRNLVVTQVFGLIEAGFELKMIKDGWTKNWKASVVVAKNSNILMLLIQSHKYHPPRSLIEARTSSITYISWVVKYIISNFCNFMETRSDRAHHLFLACSMQVGDGLEPIRSLQSGPLTPDLHASRVDKMNIVTSEWAGVSWSHWGDVSGYTVFCWPFFPIRDLWMCGITPEVEQQQCGSSSLTLLASTL